MSFTTRLTLIGAHVCIDVFSGVEGQRAHCGTLTMRPDEAEQFAEHLRFAQGFEPVDEKCATCDRSSCDGNHEAPE